jgi:hypothetical protein
LRPSAPDCRAPGPVRRNFCRPAHPPTGKWLRRASMLISIERPQTDCVQRDLCEVVKLPCRAIAASAEASLSKALVLDATSADRAADRGIL